MNRLLAIPPAAWIGIGAGIGIVIGVVVDSLPISLAAGVAVGVVIMAIQAGRERRDGGAGDRS